MAKVEGDVVAGLGGTPAPAEVPTSWTTYILTEDADDTAKKIIEGGGSIMLGPDTVGEEGRLLIAADPAGGVFGVWQPGNHKGAQRVNEPGALSWNELMTRDLATAKTFYSSLFGWTWDDLPGAPGFTYSTFKAGDRIAGGALEMNDQFPAEIPVHWMIYFAVADTDATVDAVVATGGSVLEPPRDSQFGRNAMVADPQGGIFRIIKLPERKNLGSRIT